MKTTPMIFNTAMVKAILNGEKTVTRRPAKIEYERGFSGPVIRGKDGTVSVVNFAPIARLCPFGNTGDLIYIRETFTSDPDADHDAWNDHELSYYEWAGCDLSPQFLPEQLKTTDHCLYKASCTIDMKWIPSIHMPRWASRLTLRITNVRIERIQDITPQQALLEGIKHQSMNCPIAEFGQLWNSIYNDWYENPYVWVIEFEVIHQNIDTYLKNDAN
ncbi:hypothetical protein EQ875_01614 [Photobacterium damselae subsp. damselae]|uniref:hypothetical protein n=1 Tax=Photobacterium damselae TaxID=38293 RepID=UPI00109BACD2|nr:hypothetical protein [Photobacterium damselae]TGZ35333.1 hypothetical protein EQ875_01614 [Photobacterium damselae subsp. damselae]